jgi:hypothetical protein
LGQGFAAGLNLAIVLDLFSRKVVGWAMAPTMSASLVCDRLVKQTRPILELRRYAFGSTIFFQTDSLSSKDI